ncbi:hypothetical protein ACI3L8_13800 [Vibrio campbellii]|uniref:hypothetical protein n=1 Tax=Vibrio campbellii TaxID=680 RepID=UPI0037C44CDF
MIQDLINSTKATLYERTASPLFGAFLISWCLWNWEIILVLLSNIPVMNKLSFMRSHLSGFLSASWVLFIGPTITSLAYLFLYPIPAKYVYGYSQRQQRALKSIRISVEDETPLSLEESRRLRGKLTELEDSFYAQLSSKDAEIDKLRAQLQALTVESEPESLSVPKTDVTHVKHSNTSPKQSTVSNDLMLDENKEQGITTPIIINFSVADHTYNLGVDYHNSEPGQVNVVKLKDSFSFRDKLLVKFTLDKPLQEGQFISVFDGHTRRIVDSDSFEIEKIDYENKNAFIVVEQNNPLRDNTKMVVSNKVQFAY